MEMEQDAVKADINLVKVSKVLTLT